MFNIFEKTEKHTIKEWELQTGIKLRNTNGFKGEKNKIKNNLYTRRAFKRGTQGSYIVCKTEKGLEFLKSF